MDPNLLVPGIWPCVVLNGAIGEQLDKNDQPTGKLVARVNIRFTDGPNKGRVGAYEGDVDARNSPYTMRSLKAVGWSGEFPLTRVADDITAWVEKTGGVTTAEVKHIEIKKGKRYEKWVGAGKPGFPVWDKIDALGRGPRPLAAPSKDALADAEEQMRRAMADTGSARSDEDAPAPNDDIPF